MRPPGKSRQRGDSARQRPIVISCLEKINGLVRDTVYQSVLLSDTTRPAVRQNISQWLGLSGPLKWIPHDRLNEIQHSDRGGAFGFAPKT